MMPRKSPDKRPDLTTIDPEIAALIAKIPPSGSPWPGRAAWFKRLWMAIHDVHDGEEMEMPKFLGVEPPPVSTAERIAATVAAMPPELREQYRSYKASDATWDYVIDAEGFAMCGTKPVKFNEVPHGAILIDQRSAPDAGRSDSILWHDIGARADGALPAGVVLRMGEAKLNGSAEATS